MASAGHALGALRIAAFALEQAMDSLGPEHGLADQLVDTLRDLGRYQRELSLEDPDSAPRVDRIEFISPKATEARAASATDDADPVEELNLGPASANVDEVDEVDDAAAAASGAVASDDDAPPGERVGERVAAIDAASAVAAIDPMTFGEDAPTFGELVLTHSQPEYAKKNMEVGEAMHLLYRGRCKELYLQMDRNGDGSLSPAELSSAAPKLGMTVEQLNEIFTKADRDKGGSLSIDEFVEMMGEHFGNLIEDLDEVHDSDGNTFKADETTHLSYGHKEFLKLGNSKHLFSPFDTATQIVEINVMVILFCTLFTTPMALAFKPFEDATRIADLCIDVLFMGDIVRNFNTAYFTSDDVIVFDQRAVFKHYVSAGVDAF